MRYRYCLNYLESDQGTPTKILLHVGPKFKNSYHAIKSRYNGLLLLKTKILFNP